MILDDNELGLKHRGEVASKFFNIMRDMFKIYDRQNRKDQCLYDKEMLAVYHFALGFQQRYFELGNQRIIENADDPNAVAVKDDIEHNNKTLINNYLNYLDLVKNENTFSKAGKKIYAEGLDTYFTQVIEKHPEHSYYKFSGKIKLLEGKSKSTIIKTSLQKLYDLIDLKYRKEKVPIIEK